MYIVRGCACSVMVWFLRTCSVCMLVLYTCVSACMEYMSTLAHTQFGMYTVHTLTLAHTYTCMQPTATLMLGVQREPLNPLISEERVVFGLFPSKPVMKTAPELGKTYSSVDVATIAREVCIFSAVTNQGKFLFEVSLIFGKCVCT